MSDEPIGPGISGKTTCRVCGYRYYPSVEVHGHHAAPAAAPAPRDAAFQRLWTKYAALPEYDKAEWTAAFNEIWSGGAPTPAMIDAAARALWVMGNARIGARTWESVASHYRQEAEAALRAALTAQDLPTEQQPAREAQPKPD